MSGAHSLSPALPSPPHGVVVPHLRLRVKLRKAILTHISAEPTDLAARIAVGSILVPQLLALILPGPESGFWGEHNQLFAFFVSTWAPLTWITIFSGLITRSRSARLVSIATLAAFALFSTADRYGLPLSVVTGLMGFAFPAVAKVALGLWFVRALRRRLDSGTD